jgi:hypothetical protein
MIIDKPGHHPDGTGPPENTVSYVAGVAVPSRYAGTLMTIRVCARPSSSMCARTAARPGVLGIRRTYCRCIASNPEAVNGLVGGPQKLDVGELDHRKRVVTPEQIN